MTFITPDVLVGESARVILCTTDRPIFLTLRRMSGRVAICLTLTPIDETSKEITDNDTRHGVTPEEMAHAERALDWTEQY